MRLLLTTTTPPHIATGGLCDVTYTVDVSLRDGGGHRFVPYPPVMPLYAAGKQWILLSYRISLFVTYFARTLFKRCEI